MCFFSGSHQQPERSLTRSAASVRDIRLCRALGTRAGAVPQDAQQSLTPDEVYALSAYLLHLNGIVAEGAVMDTKSLLMVQMPNRGFVPDDRPDIEE